LEKPNSETAAHISAYLDLEQQKYFYDYLNTVFNVKLEEVSGKMVIEKYKLKASPLVGKIMNELFSKKLDNPEIDEIKELEKIIRKYTEV
jgi:tRNA nucleotidyltransferase (CCA-adding enzyme)